VKLTKSVRVYVLYMHETLALDCTLITDEIKDYPLPSNPDKANYVLARSYISVTTEKLVPTYYRNK
jgi:hypothetical protein